MNGEATELRGLVLRELLLGGKIERQVESNMCRLQRGLFRREVPRAITAGLLRDGLIELESEQDGVVHYRLSEVGRLCTSAVYGRKS